MACIVCMLSHSSRPQIRVEGVMLDPLLDQPWITLSALTICVTVIALFAAAFQNWQHGSD